LITKFKLLLFILSELIVCSEYAIPKSKVRAVVSTVLSMVEVMEFIVGGKGKQLKRRPAENISTVPIVSIPDPEDKPDYKGADIDRPDQ
jgi:hypothetical protein